MRRARRLGTTLVRPLLKPYDFMPSSIENELGREMTLLKENDRSRGTMFGGNIVNSHASPPAILESLLVESDALDFRLASDTLTGSLLRVLAASKPAGKLLELGTGTGAGTAWLLDGMGPKSRLLSVDNDPLVLAVARQFLASDSRVEFRCEDAAALLVELPKASFDLIFADAWVGKYTHFDEALSLLRPGGCYVVDDMAPQNSWHDDHRARAIGLVAELASRSDFNVTEIAWSTGIVLAIRRG